MKRKIRSLLAVYDPRSGATDAERLTAKSLADKLMLANGLKESDIPEREIALPRPVIQQPNPGDFFSEIIRQQEMQRQFFSQQQAQKRFHGFINLNGFSFGSGTTSNT